MTPYDLKEMIYADQEREVQRLQLAGSSSTVFAANLILYYIRRRFLSDEGAAFTLLFLFENGHGLLSSLLAARRSFLPERYHHEGVLAHKSLQVQT